MNEQTECPGCDGEGSMMVYMNRLRCNEIGGYMKRDETGFPIYYTPDGKAMAFKTIGGPCQICQGRKVVGV